MVRAAIHQIVLHLQQEQHTFNLFETSRPALQSTRAIVPLLHTLSSCAKTKKINNRCCITMISSQCIEFVGVICHQTNDNTLRRLSQSSLNLAAFNTHETQPAQWRNLSVLHSPEKQRLRDDFLTYVLLTYFLSKRAEICLLCIGKNQPFLKTLNLDVGDNSFLMPVEKRYTVCQSPRQSTAMVPGRRYDGADD
jgi:hypothetical protein